MILVGSPVLHTKSIIPNRRRGWIPAFETDTAYLLSEQELDDSQLTEALIARQNFEAIQISKINWVGQDFQPAYRLFDSRMTPFFSFSRQVHYTGSEILWRQRPYSGFSTNIRVKYGKDSETFLNGYCTEEEQEHIGHYLRCRIMEMETAMNHMRAIVNSYNTDLRPAAMRYVLRNKESIAEIRANQIATIA